VSRTSNEAVLSRAASRGSHRRRHHRLGALVLVAVAGASLGCRSAGGPPAGPVATASASTPVPATVGTTTTDGPAPPTATVETPAPNPPAGPGAPPVKATPRPPVGSPGPVASPAGDLHLGDHGPAVQALQHRLQDLRYWVGSPDGGYGELTRQAVYAFEQTHGLPVDGALSAADRAVLDAATPVVPQSRQGLVVEVDRTHQVLIAARDGAAEWVFHVSTGTEQPYTHPVDGPSMADTPPGHHTVTKEVDGDDPGALGPLYRPKYFHPDGVAIHGYGSVPPYPASHGCVRVTFAAMDFLWAQGLAPVGTPVWVHGDPAPGRPGR
jgi:hypothetical protein